MNSAMQDAKAAIEASKKEINGAEQKLKISAGNDDDNIISGEAISNIVNKAVKEAENTLKELGAEGIMGDEIRQEVQKALMEARQELKEAHLEFRGTPQEKNDSVQELVVAQEGNEIAALTQEIVALALNAAQLGLQEANAELKASLEPDTPQKMDKKEYRRKKKELREAYK